MLLKFETILVASAAAVFFAAPLDGLAGPVGNGEPVVCNIDTNLTDDLAFRSATSNRVNLIAGGNSTGVAFHGTGGGDWNLVDCERLGSAALIEEGVGGAAANFARARLLSADGITVDNEFFVGLGGGLFEYVGASDVDGDGLKDLVFQGTGPIAGTGKVEFAVGPNAGSTAFVPLGGGAFRYAGTGDVDADGDDDIFWVTTSGQVRIDEGNGVDGVTVGANFFSIGADFVIAVVGDLTGNGQVDLVLNAAGQGTAKALELNNGVPTGTETFFATGGNAFVPSFVIDTDGVNGGDIFSVGPLNGGTGMSSNRIHIVSASLALTGPTTVALNGTPQVSGDFDDDGLGDVASATAGAVNITLFENGDQVKGTGADIPNAGGTFVLVP